MVTVERKGLGFRLIGLSTGQRVLWVLTWLCLEAALVFYLVSSTPHPSDLIGPAVAVLVLSNLLSLLKWANEGTNPWLDARPKSDRSTGDGTPRK